MAAQVEYGKPILLTVRNVEVYLVDQGSGIPTLFLHGSPESADLWSEIITRLSPHYRCLAPDLPGYGRSSAPTDFDCSLDNLAGYIDDLVGAVGITQPLNLVVHDLGGVYGLAWAVKHPQKVRRLVITNAPFSSEYHWHIFARIYRTPILGELSLRMISRWAFARVVRRGCGARKLTHDQINHTYDLITPSVKRMMLRLYRALDPEVFKGWEDELRGLAVRVPSLVLWGDRDPWIPIRFADLFGAQQVEHLVECGHWPPVEASQEVSTQLLRFLGE
jgi:pimeloyl-ACP methyl ester carboxylesterase